MYEVGKLGRLTGIGQSEHGISRGDHPEIAVTGFSRMDKLGRRAGRGQGCGDLVADMAAFTHTADDNAAGDSLHDVDRFDKGLVEKVSDSAHTISFSQQYTPC